MPQHPFSGKAVEVRFPRGPADGSASLRALSRPPLCAGNREALGEEKRRGTVPASQHATHRSTQRIRLAAKASAMDLAPSSLILLLWRLWRQGGASLVAPRRAPGRPSPRTPSQWGSWPFPPPLWPQGFPGVSRRLPAGYGQGTPDNWTTRSSTV